MQVFATEVHKLTLYDKHRPGMCGPGNMPYVLGPIILKYCSGALKFLFLTP